MGIRGQGEIRRGVGEQRIQGWVDWRQGLAGPRAGGCRGLGWSGSRGLWDRLGQEAMGGGGGGRISGGFLRGPGLSFQSREVWEPEIKWEKLRGGAPGE